MDQAWTLEPEPAKKSRECDVVGRTKKVGPILIGNFRYLDDEGGGFTFIHVEGTRLNLSWEW